MRTVDADGVRFLMGKIKGITPGNIGLGNVGNFKAVSTEASQRLTDTEKSNARANIRKGLNSLTNPTSWVLGSDTVNNALLSSAVTCSISFGDVEASVDEIVCEIDITASSNPTITFPNTVRWNIAPTFETGYHYEMSFKKTVVNSVTYYFAVWNRWSYS